MVCYGHSNKRAIIYPFQGTSGGGSFQPASNMDALSPLYCGNMYYSGDGEYVCMQCGCSYNAAKSPQTTKMDVSLNRELNSILHSANK